MPRHLDPARRLLDSIQLMFLSPKGERSLKKRVIDMLRRSLLASPLLLAAAPAWAQWVPRLPMKILVGYAPGGTADIAARIAAETIQRQHGYTVIVDNKTGAGARRRSLSPSSPNGPSFPPSASRAARTVRPASCASTA